MISSPRSRRSPDRKEIKISTRKKSISDIATSDGDISMMQIKQPVNCLSPILQKPNLEIAKLTQKVARSSNMSERQVEKRETMPITKRSKESPMMKDPSRNHPAYTRRASQVI